MPLAAAHTKAKHVVRKKANIAHKSKEEKSAQKGTFWMIFDLQSTIGSVDAGIKQFIFVFS